jgi:aminopeptidase
VRAARDRLPALRESLEVTNRRESNWTIVPCPTPAWAQLVYPDAEPDEALDRLWTAIERICRLDEEDPVAAWEERARTIVSAASRLTERRFDALHYEGPGTDFTVGLFEDVRWMAARIETAFGVSHQPNIPTEEVFTSPDPPRADGVVTSTKPLVLIDGTVVRDLVVRFEGGRVTELSASTGEETMRTIIDHDEGAARLGEIALVDDEGRIGPLNTVFYDTLLDENAASHIALGAGFPFLAADGSGERINNSDIHIDFMIGSDDLRITGITPSGERVPVLTQGRWGV